jgi:antitoxin (DNA-binding transcriptional repressor) of toxin-antitoxin stability system
MVSILDPVTEIPEGELVRHPDEVLRRVRSGEDMVVTVGGEAVVEMSPHRRPVSLTEFLSWPKADRSLLDDIRELRGDETTDDLRDPSARRG